MVPLSSPALAPILAAFTPPAQLAYLWALGLLVGLVLFARGLLAYRLGAQVSGIASSPVQGLAAGEVRVSGTVEPGPSVLVSPLQSVRCVHYRSRVTQASERNEQVLLDESRSVSFRLRDATGAMYVFPRGAHWELQPRLDQRSLLDGGTGSLDLNLGPREQFGPEDRDAQIARLLTVQGAPDHDADLFERTMGVAAVGIPGGGLGSGGGGLGGLVSGSGALDDSPHGGGLLGNLLDGDVASPLAGGRHYVESRVEPGDVVTVVGTAMPFSDVDDGSGHDATSALDDPEVAADLAAAGAAGTLRARGEDAWGNAAIPGFGIGQPVRTPQLDPQAMPEPAATAPASGSTGTSSPAEFADLQVAPDALVLASGSTPMTVLAGAPAAAAGIEMSRFWQGVGGALLAVLCAALLAVQLAVH